MDSFDIKLLISIAFTLAYSIVYLVPCDGSSSKANTQSHTSTISLFLSSGAIFPYFS